ncbi:hypothetical protein NX059_010663 [Plenodomus lindquistii]|nr:hypothetical protein NX059_010663 [Plenodomus lindquistii]
MHSAFGIFHLKNGRLHNWQYLFLIEGALTILMSFITWVWLPAGPGSAWFLNNDERGFVVKRIKDDNAMYVAHECDLDGKERTQLTRRDLIETLKDLKLWYLLIFNICASVPSQAFSVFLPLVVQGLGYSALRANLMSIPPYVCGAVGLYFFALSSDHRKDRGCHIIVGIAIALLGLIITVTVHSSHAKYAGLCILLFGSYISAPLTVAWLSGNNPEPGKRSLVLGVNGFGNLAGVIGGQLYKHKYAHRYLLPFYVTLGFVSAALIGYMSYIFILKAVNRNKLTILAGKSEAEIEAERTDGTRYADQKWTFLYGL